ncbi:inositol monophosphatase family protein [Halobacteriaceae bacterium SHR40]|uniref:inositol monophosphatase family protein n=1 Tax=Halovenus amylolytica TaxID=2500550 RepID=UPI000FE30A46
MDSETLQTVTEESAVAGATVAAKRFRTEFPIEHKDGKTDVVTAADRDAQQAVIDRIRETFPDDPVYGEEKGTATTVPASGRVWIVDPIDGTNNYVRGNRRFATSVACLIDGVPVTAANIHPALDDHYLGTPDGVTRNGESISVSDRVDPDRFEVVPTIWWDFDRRAEYAVATSTIVERFGDLRRIGSAQAALSLLAAGGVDGVITNVETNAWDTVAGSAMVEWAGGTVTDLDGEQWTHDSRGLVASNGAAHETLLETAREIENVRE